MNNGLLLCSRYAAAPNFFGYCGPEENKSLVQHVEEGIVDKEMNQIISGFETLYPYLRMISRENRINDCFDRRVVEAYWLGNKLLEKIPPADYFALLEEKLALGKKLTGKSMTMLRQRIMSKPFLPQHAFHVFNIFKRTGNDPSFHNLQTMDDCRIGWGRISSKLKIQNSKVLVRTKKLCMQAGKLSLGKEVLKELKIDYYHTPLFKNLKVGEWVSFHWGFACDKLTQAQVKNLVYYTQKAIDFYNSP